MLDMGLVNNTIEELENDRTTFDNCMKLASLYIIRDNNMRATTEVEQELDDILPQYRNYTDIKRKYQLGEVSEKAVENQINLVCKEIEEFIHTLYASTDMPIERDYIKTMVNGLQNL